MSPGSAGGAPATPGALWGPPPAGVRSKLEGMATSWRDSGKLNTQQFEAVLQGLGTGRTPDGADSLFSPALSSSLHEAFRGMGRDVSQGLGSPEGVSMPGFGPPLEGGPLAPGSLPWGQGPELGFAMPEAGGPFVFDPAQGGWAPEAVDLGTFGAGPVSPSGEEEETVGDASAPASEGAPSPSGEETQSPAAESPAPPSEPTPAGASSP